ncbi:Crp/Fnr family transcriptional regulator [Rhizobium sp. YIM 134829]|uniref:Crp/Fnr family transcriptional regulator n=1 Tax=Rhizobium sp. YIM 134829 TaxID=3390453 RepID=UPI00397A7059
MTPLSQTSIRNRLLRALTVDQFASLAPHLEPYVLPLRHMLVEANVPTAHLWFIESGLASAIATNDDREEIEVAHIGREGITGLHRLLHVEATPNRTFMQVEGTGFRVSFAAMGALFDSDKGVRDLLLRYVFVSALQMAHSSVANARYTMHERLARWLLMCHDRVDGDHLQLTHEFLSLMLGVRRSGVTAELHVLEGIHAIKATRGDVQVLDRTRLENIAGGSYGAPERAYDQLIGSPAS